MLNRAFLLIFVVTIGCTPISTPVLNPPRTSMASPSSRSLVSPVPAAALPSQTAEAVLTQKGESIIAVTHQRLDGNRLVVGSGGIPAKTLDIQLAGTPLWVVGAPVQDSTVWVVALENGQVQAFQIEGEEIYGLELNLSKLPAGMPPALHVVGSRVALISPSLDAFAATNPIFLEDGTSVYIDKNGQLRLIRQDDIQTLAVNALPDARILSDGAGRLLFLSAPTEQYPHGVLGDMLEATGITLVDTSLDPIDIQEIQIEPGDVIEGIAPIWVDLDGDDKREIVVTQSNADTGARIVVYHEDSSLLASGEPIGRGFRWRHQLVVGQFIDGGSQEIAVIRTPHIGGVIEIYSLEGDRLEIKSTLGGYSSHQIGSRNLDSALAADFNGDGLLEIVVPDQSQVTLAGVQSHNGELQIVWEAPSGGKLSTNLTAVTLSDGRLALGIGLETDLLRIWLPK